MFTSFISASLDRYSNQADCVKGKGTNENGPDSRLSGPLPVSATLDQLLPTAGVDAMMRGLST